jgi:hypothetical protein
MDIVSEDDPEYIKQALRIEKNMTFGDIPKEERVLIFTVHRNDNIIEKIYEKVSKARTYLEEFEKEHLNFNHKS